MKTSTRQRLLQEAAACRRTAAKCRRDGDKTGAAAACRRRGRLLKACGEVGLALEAYREAADLNPCDALAQCGLGQALAAVNCCEEAKARLERAANLAPENPRIRFLRESIRGGSPPRAPRRYVTDLFDDYCNSCKIKYDLFVAADVLIYIGDLDEMFEAVKTCSRQESVFVFSVEERGKAGYTLQPSARYAHSRRYVCRRIRKHGMRLIGRSRIRIRREKDRWAHGRLYEVAL